MLLTKVEDIFIFLVLMYFSKKYSKVKAYQIQILQKMFASQIQFLPFFSSAEQPQALHGRGVTFIKFCGRNWLA